MRSTYLLAGVIAGLLTAPAFASTNLVSNGGFETGDFTSWAQTPANDLVYVDAYPQEGDYAALFQNPTDPVTIGQTVSGLNANGIYNWSFYIANDTAGDNSFNARFNGHDLVALTNQSEHGYTLFSGTVQASGTGDVAIAFDAHNAPGTIYLDNVSLAAVPEAATWAMMLGGFGLVGAAMRRRDSAAVVAA